MPHKKKPEPEETEMSGRRGPAAEEESESNMAEDIAALQSELDKLKTDVQETNNSYLRTLADFDNFRKRQREEAARQANLAREGIIAKLLPIMDNFERALQAADAQHSYESLVEGVSLTLRQLSEMLEKEGVQPINAVGQEFNPEFHEAMMSVESDEYPPHTVVEELEKGYVLDGKVLRPARVTVSTQPD